MSLSGKVAIVTGSSRGIGKAIALGLAQEGTAVVVAGAQQEPLLLYFNPLDHFQNKPYIGLSQLSGLMI